MKKTTYKNIKMGDNSFRGQISKIIKMLLIVLIIFGVFYLFTIYLVNKSDSDSSSNDSSVSDETYISYEEILAGSSFDMSGEYLVIYYNQSDDEMNSEFTNLISEYKNKDNSLSVYIVDMDNALNTKYVSNESNSSPKAASELKIKDSTLIKFNNGSVSDYIEGKDNIINYLK